jgi:2-iminobutanoate/2-iminopropanoate deaminase
LRGRTAAAISRGMRQTVSTEKAPAAIGPYVQAVKASAGEMVFCSGQIAIDPATGEVERTDVAAQTERVLDNLGAVLEAAGCGFEHVVRCTIFLKDMGDFATVNEVYAKRFTSDPPSRATVEVSRLPKDVDVEIDAIAIKPS